jgi:hypothetical protein
MACTARSTSWLLASLVMLAHICGRTLRWPACEPTNYHFNMTKRSYHALIWGGAPPGDYGETEKMPSAPRGGRSPTDRTATNYMLGGLRSQAPQAGSSAESPEVAQNSL